MGYTLPVVNFNVLVAGLYTERWEGINNGLAWPEVGHSFVFLSLQTNFALVLLSAVVVVY